MGALHRLKPQDHGDIPFYIVRMLFAKGKGKSKPGQKLNESNYRAAKVLLQKLLRDKATEPLYLFNLALVHEQWACDILRVEGHKRTLEQTQKAVDMLESARRTYKRLEANKKLLDKTVGIPQRRIQTQLKHIGRADLKGTLLENAQNHLTWQKEFQQRKEARERDADRKLKASLRKEERAKEKELEKERRRKEELRRKHLEAKKKGESITFVEPADRRDRKRKREYEEEQATAKRAKRDEFNHHDQFETSNNHNEANGTRFDEEEDPLKDEEEGQVKRLKRKKKKKKKSKKGPVGDIDEDVWKQLEVKIEEIVRAADLNELTNRQVKKQLAAIFPEVNIKIYKQRIKKKINDVAAELAQNDM